MKKVVGLAGNPNCGKTTLFNTMTGSRQHVGNYPGVTVEKKEGTYSIGGKSIHLVDLPGTYSLTAYSEEEIVARDYITAEKPDAIVNIVDATNLERNLYLTVQLMELGVPVCIALNMIDAAESGGLKIDHEKLSNLLDTPVIPTVARDGKGKEDLTRAVWELEKQGDKKAQFKISYGEDLDSTLIEMEKLIEEEKFLTSEYPARWVALKYLENDTEVIKKGDVDTATSKQLLSLVDKVSEHLKKTLDTYPEAMIADYRYGYISSIMRQGIIEVSGNKERIKLSDKIDRVVTNRLLGPVIMMAIIFGLYEFTFTYSEVPVGWVESFFGWANELASNNMSEGLLKSLVVSGIIDGIGGVMGFAPLIMFMFFGISILEDSGYLARVAYMLDRVFSFFGLHGNSVMAFIVSGGIAGGCAVPGVMASRTLKSPREKLATLLTVPFMNCGAKLPVMALLVGAFFKENAATLMLIITMIAWLGALIVAKILRMTVIKGEATPFVMELPPYRMPTVRGLLIHTWERTWQYIKKAGTVILGISILIWAMMTFPGISAEDSQKLEAKRTAITASVPAVVMSEIEAAAENEEAELSPEATTIKEKLLAIDMEEAEVGLRTSFAGSIGTFMEPVSQLAGFNWKTNIALVGGFAAKEVVVSTLGTAYSLGEVDPEETATLEETLQKQKDWSPLAALSLIIFTIFYAPCFVTVVCIAKEAGSWKWGAFSMVFNTVLAFTLSVIIFQVGTAFGLLV